jgi:hypothetical protein
MLLRTNVREKGDISVRLAESIAARTGCASSKVMVERAMKACKKARFRSSYPLVSMMSKTMEKLCGYDSKSKKACRCLSAHFLKYEGRGGTRFDAPRVGCQDLPETKS